MKLTISFSLSWLPFFATWKLFDGGYSVFPNVDLFVEAAGSVLVSFQFFRMLTYILRVTETEGKQ